MRCNRRLVMPMLIGLCALFWGMSFFATTVALESGLEPMELLALRWSMAALLFVILVATGIIRVNLRGTNIAGIIFVGFLQPCIYSIFETIGIGMTSTSESSILIATIPLMVLITGRIFFKRAINFRTTVAIILALTGVCICIVFADGFSIGSKLGGYIVVLSAVFVSALYCHASANASNKYNPMEMTYVMTIMGGIFFSTINFAMGYGFHGFKVVMGSFKLFFAVVFLGVCCSCICYIIFNYVLGKMNPASASNIIANSTTAVGVISGVAFAGDPFGWYTVLGLAMTLVGIWLTSRDTPIDPAEAMR